MLSFWQTNGAAASLGAIFVVAYALERGLPQRLPGRHLLAVRGTRGIRRQICGEIPPSPRWEYQQTAQPSESTVPLCTLTQSRGCRSDSCTTWHRPAELGCLRHPCARPRCCVV